MRETGRERRVGRGRGYLKLRAIGKDGEAAGPLCCVTGHVTYPEALRLLEKVGPVATMGEGVSGVVSGMRSFFETVVLPLRADSVG